MKDFYCLDIEFPDVDFNKYYIKCDQVGKIHHSHLYIHVNEIELRIFYDDKTYFGEKFSMWSQRIDWNKFGSFIKVIKIGEKRDLRRIDLSLSKLCGIQNSTTNYEGKSKYVIIKLDTTKIYWNPIKERINTAEFYLADNGFRVVESFYTVLFGFNDNFNIKRMNGMNVFYNLGKSKFRPEFNTFSRDNKSNRIAEIVKEPKIQFKYKKTVSEDEAIFYSDVVSHLASFFYHCKIDYSLIRIHLPEHTITIKRVERKNFFDSSGSLSGFNNYWDFHKFLQSKWQKRTLINFKVLSKAIELFNQALVVDSNSEYLIRFNILEICNNLKHVTEKFNFIVNSSTKRNKYKKALEFLLETIEETEHEQFKNKWMSISGKLQYKPMKSPLIRFLESQNMKLSDFPISVSDLKELRDNIVHGSIDKIDREQLRKANILLYRINGILILNLIGIKEWKLNTELT